MPIKATCQCGASFAAKDELAGKTVKCPKCQPPLRIATAGAAPAAAPVARAAAAPAAAAAIPRSASDSLFDEVGLKSVAAGMKPCPGCGEPLESNVVLCLKCGFNLKLGRKMSTTKMGGGGGGGEVGHGDVASTLLDRAAQALEEDQEEEKRKTGEGMPWWVYAALLAVLLGFLTVMMVIANKAESDKQKEKEKGQGGALAAPAARLVV